MASPPKQLPPVPTEPGEFVLSKDGKAWEPVCAAEQATSSDQLPPGDL